MKKPKKAKAVRCVVVSTGNGGGIIGVKGATVPAVVWESEEARQWLIDHDTAGFDRNGTAVEFEVMSAEDARGLARQLVKACRIS